MVTALVQARLDSSRLPRKVLMDLGGRPILWHVLNNTRKAFNDVLLVTPDKELVLHANSWGFKSFIGSEHDVLDRYYQAALLYEAEHIARITADNPLIRLETMHKVIDLYKHGDYDWVANCRLKTTFPIGDDIEIFSFKALERAWNESRDPAEADCVTSYIYKHPELFKLGIVENDKDESHLSWTVDTQEDLDRVRQIYTGREVKCRT